MRHRPSTARPEGLVARGRLAALPQSTIWPLPGGANPAPLAARIAAACTTADALVALIDPPTVRDQLHTRNDHWISRLLTPMRAVAEFGRRPVAVVHSHADADRLTAALTSDDQAVQVHVAGEHPSPAVDLVITAIAPHHQLTHIIATCARHWARLLAPGGILAVHVRTTTDPTGHLLDPTCEVVTAAQHAGLHYLQHILALRVPITDGQLQAQPTPTQQALLRRAATLGRPARHLPVHDDLLLFTRAATTQPAWTRPDTTSSDQQPTGHEARDD